MSVQRVADAWRELRIKALGKEAVSLIAKGRRSEVRDVAMRMREEINKRSPAQVARMERAIRARLDPYSRAIFDKCAK